MIATISKTAFLTLVLCLIGAPGVAQAQSIIRQPGNHPDYTVEIEPHLAFQWTQHFGSGDGI